MSELDKILDGALDKIEDCFSPRDGMHINNAAACLEEYGKAYHEHMMRWRIIGDGDLPEEGQYAVCETSEGFNEVWRWLDKYANDVVRWKPIDIGE